MGTFKLENEHIRIDILSMGAELCSLLDKRDGIEHIWKADPKFWPRHAPILFPCVGESRDGKISIDDVDYPMGRHGFARFEEFSVVEKNDTKVVLELKSNAQTRIHFPFEFVFTISYELMQAKLVQSFKVENLGEDELGFQLGGHPAFAVPFSPDEKYDEYEICFDQPLDLKRHLLTDQGLYSGKARLFLEHNDHFELYYGLFEEDALVFKNILSKQVWIQHKNGGKRLQVDYQGFPHLGIWSVPGADYVCLEPWIGCADRFDQPTDFFEKDSLIKLHKAETFEASFRISVS